MAYDKYKSKNPVLKALLRHFTRSLIGLAESIEIKNVADAGCGEGRILKKFASAKSCLRVLGLDISEDKLGICRELNPRASLLCCDITALPLKKGCVDLLLCLETLEHLQEPRRALQELRELSCRHLIFSVPDHPYFRISNLLRGRYLSSLGNEKAHLNLWTFKAFSRLIAEYFDILNSCRPFPWIILLCKPKDNA